MNKPKAFLRNYQYEIWTLLIDIVLIFVAYKIAPPIYVALISFAVLLLSTFFVVYKKTKEKDFYYFPLNKPGQDFDWVGRGDLKFVKNEKCFEITNSHIGFILPKTSNWDNYKYELDFKITNKSVGIIVRANDLSNYLMYQIFCDKVKSHIRINGSWIVVEEPSFDNNKKILQNNWYRLTIIAEKRIIKIQIFDGKQLLTEKSLSIPSNITLIQKEVDEKGVETGDTIKLKQEIDFDFGSIGLRNCSNERALIKNIFIEKL